MSNTNQDNSFRETPSSGLLRKESEGNIIQCETNKLLTTETKESIQSYISCIESDIENSSLMVEVNVDYSKIEKECEKTDSVNIIVKSPLYDAGDDAISKPSVCEVAFDENKNNVDSGKTLEVQKSVGLGKNDLESGKSSSNIKKKKAKPMSESMQRLTAKKESPDSKRSTDLASAAERKARADEARKQKIIEQRRKDDERRAAVLERRKKLDEVEREKKEALFKKLTNKDQNDLLSKNSPMKKRYSLSTSNLHQLKKTKPVEARIDLNTTFPKKTDKTKEKGKLERPRSAMLRSTMGPSPDTTRNSKKCLDSKRPMTAFGTRMSTPTLKLLSKPIHKSISSKQNIYTTQPPRPSTALGVPNADKRRSAPTKQFRSTSTEKSPFSTCKTIQKAKSTTGLASKDSKKIQSIEKKSYSNLFCTKKDAAKEKVRNSKSSSFTKEKNENLFDEKSGKSSKPAATSNKKELTEEEAKKALAERRKKAKEEAEAKAKAEKEKDEEERHKREEEEKRLADQLKLEEERNVILLEQLKREEEERRQKMIDEKEQRDREERERLEEEQRQREEEIDRKAKLEFDRIQKEQEKQEMLLEEERIERKKVGYLLLTRGLFKGRSFD